MLWRLFEDNHPLYMPYKLWPITPTESSVWPLCVVYTLQIVVGHTLILSLEQLNVVYTL